MRHMLWIILLGSFILEGTIVHWLMPVSWQNQVYVSANITLIVVLYVGFYINRHTAMIYGLVFGLLEDFIFFGHMLGPHSFAMGLLGYSAGLFQRRIPHFVLNVMLFFGLGAFFFELINYGLNKLFRIISLDFGYALTHYMLPSVLFNMLFALAIYLPMRKLIDILSPSNISLKD